jgi:hypothetical protein
MNGLLLAVKPGSNKKKVNLVCDMLGTFRNLVVGSALPANREIES